MDTCYAHDDRYAEKAARISALAKDIGEVMAAEKNHLATLMRNNTCLPQYCFSFTLHLAAWHAPQRCS
jgi:hypothetical protein